MKTKLQKITKRLVIRPYELADHSAWCTTFSSMLKPKNKWDIPNKLPDELSIGKFREILTAQLKNRKSDSFYDFGVFLKSGTLVGGVSLMDISRGVFQNAYLGYRIFNNFWGKGYGAEAVRATIDIAFQKLNLHRIEAGIEPGNKRSVGLAKSVGLRREGFSPKRLFLDGRWVDLVLFAATAEDFGRDWRSKAKKETKLKRFRNGK